MLVRTLASIVLCSISLTANAFEPQLVPELRCYTWMVGDWVAEKVWSPESAFNPTKTARGYGNPNVRVSVVDGGKALRIEYAYRIVSGMWEDVEPILYRYAETVHVDGEYFLIRGQAVQKEDSTKQETTYEFRVHRGADSRDWAWKLGDENQLMRVCGNPKQSDVVVLVCRRDATRANPNYVPFTPKTPATGQPLNE